MAYNFKKKEEVEEFLKNLGIEYRFGCFSEKKPEVCHLLGDYMEAISKDFLKAFHIYKNNCDINNFAESCYKTGAYYMQGKAMQKYEDQQAIDYLEKGCKLGSARSCHVAGVLAMNSPDNVRDSEQALGYFEEGCKLEKADSCQELSAFLIHGNKTNTIEKNMEKAAKYAQLGCDLGNVDSCLNLSRMYKLGEGVEQNIELSKKYEAVVNDYEEQMKQIDALKFQEGIED